MKPKGPQRPSSLDPLAVEILERLRAYPEAEHFILGGHFALKHYLDYRPTHDIDAWWSGRTSASMRQSVLQRLRTILGEVATAHSLTVHERQTLSEVVSLQLKRGKQVVFSVQIAPRSVELEEPIGRDGSPWTPIPIETLADNIGAKMNALVNRGAPRDFLDVYTVVSAGLATVEDCWAWWQRKNEAVAVDLAKAQVLRHLAAIELRQPMEQIPAEERGHVAQRRRWFRESLGRVDSLWHHPPGREQTP